MEFNHLVSIGISYKLLENIDLIVLLETIDRNCIFLNIMIIMMIGDFFNFKQTCKFCTR